MLHFRYSPRAGSGPTTKPASRTGRPGREHHGLIPAAEASARRLSGLRHRGQATHSHCSAPHASRPCRGSGVTFRAAVIAPRPERGSGWDYGQQRERRSDPADPWSARGWRAGEVSQPGGTHGDLYPPAVPAAVRVRSDTRKCLAPKTWQYTVRSDDQGLGQGVTGLTGGPHLEDVLHADDNDATSPLPDHRRVQIRYADSGSSQGPTVMLTSPWPASVYAFAPMWGSLSGTPAGSPLTCRASVRLNAARTCCLRRRWASSWPGSSPRPTWARSTSSRRTSEPRPPCLSGLSVKIRGSRALEVKVYRGSPGILEVAGRAHGRLERWLKWSFPCDPSERGSGGRAGWATVHRRRRISRFSLASTARAGRPGPADEPGCEVELVEVGAWPGLWSLGLEATGPASLLRAELEAAALVFAQVLPGEAELGTNGCSSYGSGCEPHAHSDLGQDPARPELVRAGEAGQPAGRPGGGRRPRAASPLR